MTVTLCSPDGRAVVTLAPEQGGRVAQLEVDGLGLLAGEPADGPLQWGCYPMVPWAGRLDRGQLRYDGRVHQFPLTMAPHAIHGTTWGEPWAVISADATAASLRIDLGAPWPFGGSVRHDVLLSDDELVLRLSVEAGDRPMPVAVGWHPWFRRRLARGGPARLELAARHMWARGADGLPTGELVEPPPGPWDDCFTGVTGPPCLTWPDALSVRVESDCDQWVVYDEQAHAICVEPQSAPPDGLNHAPPVIHPGQAHVRTMTIRWSSP